MSKTVTNISMNYLTSPTYWWYLKTWPKINKSETEASTNKDINVKPTIEGKAIYCRLTRCPVVSLTLHLCFKHLIKKSPVFFLRTGQNQASNQSSGHWCPSKNNHVHTYLSSVYVSIIFVYIFSLFKCRPPLVMIGQLNTLRLSVPVCSFVTKKT